MASGYKKDKNIKQSSTARPSGGAGSAYRGSTGGGSVSSGSGQVLSYKQFVAARKRGASLEELKQQAYGGGMGSASSRQSGVLSYEQFAAARRRGVSLEELMQQAYGTPTGKDKSERKIEIGNRAQRQSDAARAPGTPAAAMPRQTAAAVQASSVGFSDDRSTMRRWMDQILGIDSTQVTGGKTDWGKLVKGTVYKGLGESDVSLVGGLNVMDKVGQTVLRTANPVVGYLSDEMRVLGKQTLNDVIGGVNDVFGTDLKTIDEGESFIEHWLGAVKKKHAANREYFAENANTSRSAQIVDKFGTSFVAAVPQSIEAILLGKIKAAEYAGIKSAELADTAARGALQYASGLAGSKGAHAAGIMAAEGMKNTFRNPQFWTSYLEAIGSGYESAKAAGMSDADAELYSLVNGFFNATIEIGGGDEDLGGFQMVPEKVRRAIANGDKYGLLKWSKDSVIGEGLEEVEQGIIERGLLQQAKGASVRDMFSNDPNNSEAAFNPWTAGEEFVGGAVVGGMLGGAETAITKALNTRTYRARELEASTQSAETGTAGKKSAPAESGAQKFRYEDYPADAYYTDGSIYSYDFLTAQKPMQITEMPPLSSLQTDGKVDREKAVNAGVRNLAAVGRESGNAYVVKNNYTKRDVSAGVRSLRHSLKGDKASLIRTNARLSAVAGELIRNAIPINGLAKENDQAKGTYAMIAIANSGKATFAVVITVDQFENVESFEAFDVTHAINGRIKREDWSSNTDQPLGETSYGLPQSSTKSIAEVLEIVNETHRSILSKDVLDHFKEERPQNGYYTGRALFQMADAAGTETAERINRLMPTEEQAAGERKGAAAGSRARKKGTVSFDGGTINGETVRGVDRTKLNRQQKKAVALVEALADAVNIDYVLFDGDAEGVQGAYVRGGTVYVNVNAGMAVGKSLAGATLSHELTHHLQEYAPEEYRELRDFLAREVLGKTPGQFDALVRRQLWLEPQLSYDEAVDEVIANACQTMLRSSKAVTELARQNMTLAEKIADVIEEIAAKIRAAFEGVSADDLGFWDAVRAVEEELDRVQAMWDKALTAASVNYNAEQTTEKDASEGDENTTFADEHTRTTQAEPTPSKDEMRQRIEAGREQYMSFDNTTNGLANDGLTKYSDEMADLIVSKGDVIVDSYDTLKAQVKIAFTDKSKKHTLYFGNIPYVTLAGIEADVTNMPKKFGGHMFKVGRDYSLVATLDSIRHVNDDGSLTMEDVIKYMDRYADTVLDYDDVHYSEYVDNRGNKIDGLRFKKSYPDGVQVSYDIVSNRRKSLALQTDYIANKKKSASTPLLQNAGAATPGTGVNTPKARGGQTSNKNVSQTGQNSKAQSQVWDDVTGDTAAASNGRQNAAGKKLPGTGNLPGILRSAFQSRELTLTDKQAAEMVGRYDPQGKVSMTDFVLGTREA